MKYSKVRVKCSRELLKEIDRFMEMMVGFGDGLEDFLLEVNEGVSEKLEGAEKRNDAGECIVYAEFSMTLPKSVYERAKNHIQDQSSEYTELYMLFENIANVKEYSFKR